MGSVDHNLNSNFVIAIKSVPVLCNCKYISCIYDAHMINKSTIDWENSLNKVCITICIILYKYYISRLTIVSCEAKKKHATCDKQLQVSYLQVALL